MNMMLAQMDAERKVRSQDTPRKHKALLGQYLTPISVAKYMASLIDLESAEEVKLLDPGAGQGSLGIAAAEFIWNRDNKKRVSLDSFEMDKTITGMLRKNLETAQELYHFQFSVYEEDYIQSSVNDIGWNVQKKYTHVVMNPPYQKMATRSLHHRLLEDIGINTVNLYSAFVWLALEMVKPDGQVIAIIPRSFCNGTYYRPFREYILKKASIEHIHVFESRTDAFKDDSVLQENIIIALRKERTQSNVKVSWSSDTSLNDYHEKTVKMNEIAKDRDEQLYFHIPIGIKKSANNALQFHIPFDDLGLSVSTGPIVDFRMRELLRDRADGHTVPLLYPGHFKNYRMVWPGNGKRPNAILIDEQVKKGLFSKGNYVVIRRFSSKEEKHRVIASLVSETDLEYEYCTFENHLNVIHRNRNGLDYHLALGLICYLNSDFLDSEFRKFSGHTQVNATDLRNLAYPSYDELKLLGIAMMKKKEWLNFDLLIRDTIYE